MRGGMISFLICSLIAYVLFGGVLFGCQRSLLYHPNQTIPDPAEFGLDGISVERIESDGGHRLLAWWRTPASPEKPVILYFHGNAGHLGHRSDKVRPYLARGYGLLLVTYRYNAGAVALVKQDCMLTAVRQWRRAPQGTFLIVSSSMAIARNRRRSDDCCPARC